MIVPDFSLIVEILLSSEGFQTASALFKRIDYEVRPATAFQAKALRLQLELVHHSDHTSFRRVEARRSSTCAVALN